MSLFLWIECYGGSWGSRDNSIAASSIPIQLGLWICELGLDMGLTLLIVVCALLEAIYCHLNPGLARSLFSEKPISVNLIWWQKSITRGWQQRDLCRYWPLIGPKWSIGPDTGLWLVQYQKIAVSWCHLEYLLNLCNLIIISRIESALHKEV